MRLNGTQKDILRRAADLLDAPENRTTGVLARDYVGRSCSSSDGACWCAEGAIFKLVRASGMGAMYAVELVNSISDTMGRRVACVWDSGVDGQEEVLSVMRKLAA